MNKAKAKRYRGRILSISQESPSFLFHLMSLW